MLGIGPWAGVKTGFEVLTDKGRSNGEKQGGFTQQHGKPSTSHLQTPSNASLHTVVLEKRA